MECKKQSNIRDCNCTYPCDKKGVCCICIRYHRERDELPACYFPDDIERGYDRSVASYMRLRKP